MQILWYNNNNYCIYIAPIQFTCYCSKRFSFSSINPDGRHRRVKHGFKPVRRTPILILFNLNGFRTSNDKLDLSVCTFSWACYLHCWQSNRDLYRAAVATRGWVSTEGENLHSLWFLKIKSSAPCPALRKAVAYFLGSRAIIIQLRFRCVIPKQLGPRFK